MPIKTRESLKKETTDEYDKLLFREVILEDDLHVDGGMKEVIVEKYRYADRSGTYTEKKTKLHKPGSHPRDPQLGKDRVINAKKTTKTTIHPDGKVEQLVTTIYKRQDGTTFTKESQNVTQGPPLPLTLTGSPSPRASPRNQKNSILRKLSLRTGVGTNNIASPKVSAPPPSAASKERRSSVRSTKSPRNSTTSKSQSLSPSQTRKQPSQTALRTPQSEQTSKRFINVDRTKLRAHVTDLQKSPRTNFKDFRRPTKSPKSALSARKSLGATPTKGLSLRALDLDDDHDDNNEKRRQRKYASRASS